MLATTVIRVENLSKRYQLGTIGYGSLTHDLAAWWAKVRGKEDPNSRIGEKSRLDLHGEFWALRDICLDIEQGDRVGIIGRNGAGKSTFLKLLSRITAPTMGTIKIQGRIASLLEVGTGFHPELSGRENIFLNGAILGMKRREIQRKFDEIVDFAGVEQFIDTPVKRYSSGMYVKLAFSVSAHLESEILIVDEVLAVGDSDFQKKSIAKMEKISREQGKTVLFVSHNISMLKELCNKGALLVSGTLAKHGALADVVNEYSGSEKANLASRTTSGLAAKILNDKGEAIREIELHQPLIIELAIPLVPDVSQAYCSIDIQREDGVKVISSVNVDAGYPGLVPGATYQARFDDLRLYPGRYRVSVWMADVATDRQILHEEGIVDFLVEKNPNLIPRSLPLHTGVIFRPASWHRK